MTVPPSSDRFLQTQLRGNDDRLAVLESDLPEVPGTAGCAASQRVDGHHHMIAGPQRLLRPSVAAQYARSRTFQVPHDGAAILPLDLQQEIGVWIGVFELLDDALELDRVVLIEHRKRVMRHCGAARSKEDNARQQGNRLPSHACLPIDLVVVARSAAADRVQIAVIVALLDRKKQSRSLK